jgi:hypothetical protein
MRTFRLDRVTRVAVSDGVFDVPTGFDPAAQVLAGIARTPWRYQASVRVQLRITARRHRRADARRADARHADTGPPSPQPPAG